ncbi:MAG: hypothetical protein OXI72_09240 [Gemmatimonadota bacterium]|nr:hypothetical protein [Gemmatimonadota bacterium]
MPKPTHTPQRRQADLTALSFAELREVLARAHAADDWELVFAVDAEAERRYIDAGAASPEFVEVSAARRPVQREIVRLWRSQPRRRVAACKPRCAALPSPRARSTRQQHRTQHRGESDGEASESGDASPAPPPHSSPAVVVSPIFPHWFAAFLAAAYPDTQKKGRSASAKIESSPKSNQNAPRR